MGSALSTALSPCAANANRQKSETLALAPPLTEEAQHILGNAVGAVGGLEVIEGEEDETETEINSCEGLTQPWGKVQMLDASQLQIEPSDMDNNIVLADGPLAMADAEQLAQASANCVVTMTDALSKPDSPKHTQQFTTEPPASSRNLQEADKDACSPSPSEESVATPETDFCTVFDVTEPLHKESRPSRRTSNQAPPGTPTQTNQVATMVLPASPEDQGDFAMESPRVEGSGFTPINGRQISPPNMVSTFEDDEHDMDTESGDLEQGVDDDMPNVDDEITEGIDDDLTLTVVAPCIENDTLTLQASHDDSETEMLRKFVTRVAADRNAKAAAAAAALAKKSQRPKRRSGSTGSIASTGSPMAKSDTPHKRTPLGEKSTNSPSPLKKRKLGGGDLGKTADCHDVSEDSIDVPRLKRRRKRIDPVLDLAGDSLMASLDIDPGSAELGPRRSTRSRNSRVALKPTAPSANSIALSLIPVRLPGMAGMMDDATMESHLAVARNRSDEKDVVAVTRVNTRKNKGNSMPPKLVLARQAEDPSGWRMKELKSVFDAKESRATEIAEEVPDGRKSRKAKGVRWAEELVRFQGEEAPSAFKSLASSLLADILMSDAAVEAEEPVTPQPEPVVDEPSLVPEPVEKPASTPVKKALPRRTRSSRLQAPTPVEKIVEKAAPLQVTPGPVRSSTLPKAAATVNATMSGASTEAGTAMGKGKGVATRRSKIAKLGMGVNGTPAPKRRGRAAIV